MDVIPQFQQANRATTLSDLGNAIPKIYYSTQSIAVTTTSYEFFQKLSTEVNGLDTNMSQPGNFSEGTSFLAYGVDFSVTGARAANPTGVKAEYYEELMHWMEASTLTLKINNIEWFQAPLVAFMSQVNFGLDPTSAGDGVAVTGQATPSRWFPLKSLKSNYIPFESKVQFVWTLNTWDTTLTATNINGYKF